MTAPMLYHVVCAAPPAFDVTETIARAHERGWDVCVVATPSAARWLNQAQLQEVTGHPVRNDYKLPDEPDVLPPPDAMLVAPATFNTINKWAAGISDTLALGLVTEAVGMGLPLVAVPFLSTAQARHPAFASSLATLRDAGVTMLYDPERFPLTEPRQSDAEQRERFPWHQALDALDTARDR